MRSKRRRVLLHQVHSSPSAVTACAEVRDGIRGIAGITKVPSTDSGGYGGVLQVGTYVLGIKPQGIDVNQRAIQRIGIAVPGLGICRINSIETCQIGRGPAALNPV